MSITVIIIAITVIVSLFAFKSQKVMDDLIFYPAAITEKNQYYRFISYGFIHADFMHLIFNMYAFYLFGGIVEDGFRYIFGSAGSLLYLIMYVSALAVCLIPSYNRNKDNYYYKSLGASGAVSAAIFAAILMNPVTGIGLIFIPTLYIPGFVFGPLYLIITAYLDKRGGGNINHSAHLWGALYGIVFLIAMCFALRDTDQRSFTRYFK